MPKIYQSESYDFVGPLRNPLSRRSVAEATVDMARVIAVLAGDAPDGCVTEEDLHRAGFTPAEVGNCRAAAVAGASKVLRPRQVRRAA